MTELFQYSHFKRWTEQFFTISFIYDLASALHPDFFFFKYQQMMHSVTLNVFSMKVIMCQH